MKAYIAHMQIHGRAFYTLNPALGPCQKSPRTTCSGISGVQIRGSSLCLELCISIGLILSLGLHEVRVASVDEAMLILKLGIRHRRVASTRLNYQSSRSHSIYTIKLVRLVNLDKPSGFISRYYISRPSHNYIRTHGSVMDCNMQCLRCVT